MKPRIVRLGILVVLAALFLSACNLPLGNRSLKIPVRINEERMLNILQAIQETAMKNANVDGQVNFASVDMIAPDTVRVAGSATGPNSQQISGSFDILVGALEGNLTVQVTNINLTGFDAAPRLVDQLNQQLAQSLNDVVRENGFNARVTSVSVTDTELEIMIEVPITKEN